MIGEGAPLGLQRGTVRVVAADPGWPALFRVESDRLSAAVDHAGLPPLAFEHVGSTAVPGLDAKPILDLMAGCQPDTDWQPYIDVLVAAGYERRGPQGVSGRELLVLGPEEARRHHLNLVEAGGKLWRESLLFRDRIRAEPALKAAYAALKRELASRHAVDRGAYAAGKAAFIAGVLRQSPAAGQ